MPMNPWLEPELQRGLRPVHAPAELWNRVQGAQAAPSSPSNRGLVWAMAAAVTLAAVALSLVRTTDETAALRALNNDPESVAFHCQNPAQLRAWVRAKTGLDLPLRAELAPSIELIGAQTMEGNAEVEVAYRAADRDAVLLVSRADSGPASVSHSHASGNVSSWVMAGQRFTLASASPADLQLACKLCHLD
jgi:hypothetical protein